MGLSEIARKKKEIEESFTPKKMADYAEWCYMESVLKTLVGMVNAAKDIKAEDIAMHRKVVLQYCRLVSTEHCFKSRNSQIMEIRHTGKANLEEFIKDSEDALLESDENYFKKIKIFVKQFADIFQAYRFTYITKE